MTEPTQDRKDEEAWLAVLAGREIAPDDGMPAAQAAALRKALKRRQARMAEELPAADKALFSRILVAVHLDHSEHGEPANGTHTGDPLPEASKAASSIRWRTSSHKIVSMPPVPQTTRPNKRPWLWGVAASITLATVLSWTVLIDDEPDRPDVLRGTQGTVLMDPDPAARRTQLEALLAGAGAKPEVRIDKSGRVVITVSETPQVLEALGGERIF
ncbi:MAG: hypothetical protein ACK5Y0_17370, partial [Pseudomonadota bacterium]